MSCAIKWWRYQVILWEFDPETLTCRHSRALEGHRLVNWEHYFLLLTMRDLQLWCCLPFLEPGLNQTGRVWPRRLSRGADRKSKTLSLIIVLKVWLWEVATGRLETKVIFKIWNLFTISFFPLHWRPNWRVKLHCQNYFWFPSNWSILPYFYWR